MNKTEIEALKKEVYEANMLLYKYKLAIHTWGNVSKISSDRKYMIIKPSGISYEKMTWEDMVVVDLDNNVIDSKNNPSTDTPTHTIIYKNQPEVKAIMHSHSPYATAFAQAGKDIPLLGTTHADNFYGPVPCTRELSDDEINGEYEHNTGVVILEHFKAKKLSFKAMGAVLVKEHGPFCWSSKSAKDAVDLALTLEQVAKMALFSQIINPQKQSANLTLQEKHYQRKHGVNSYYGQKKPNFSILKDVDVIFSDMDGTLLQSDKTISNNSLKIIKNLQNNQKLFGIATGRPYYFLKQEIALLNPDLPIISCNGALIYDYKKNELIYSNSFSEMQNETIINILIKNNITFLIYSTNKMYGYSNQKHSKWFDWINASNETKSPQYRSDFVAINKIETQNLLKQKIDIVKFLIIKTDSNNDDLIQAQKELKLIEEIYLVQSHKDVIDIMKVNSTKGNGIEIIAKKFNLNLNKTLVFGDENNDISMFEKAKFSVAMFQASDLVKKSATFITKSNDEDGISYFIENNL